MSKGSTTNVDIWLAGLNLDPIEDEGEINDLWQAINKQQKGAIFSCRPGRGGQILLECLYQDTLVLTEASRAYLISSIRKRFGLVLSD